MALNDDLKAEVERIFATRWNERDGRVVPDPEDDAAELSDDTPRAVARSRLSDDTRLSERLTTPVC